MNTNKKAKEDKIDFFVSYNRLDKQWAEWIAWQLENAGYTTIIQAWDFRPGGNFVTDMQRATANAERTIAVLSPDYLASIFTQPEWNAAFASDPTGERGILLPIRVRNCELTGLLPQIVYIDLVGLSAEEANEALLNGVKRSRAKPIVAPNFPGKMKQAEPDFPEKSWKLESNKEEFIQETSQAVLTSNKTTKHKSKITSTSTDKIISNGQDLKDFLDDTIQVSQTRYLDCLDSARFSSIFSDKNIPLLRLLYVKAQFILAIISGDIIIVTENQLLDSKGFLDAFDELLKAAKKSKRQTDLPIRLALQGSNADVYEMASKNLVNEKYTLSLWKDLGTDIERRKDWASLIAQRKKPGGKDLVILPFEKAMLGKLWKAFEFLDESRCVPAKDASAEFANKIDQVALLSKKDISEMSRQRRDTKHQITKQKVFTSKEETAAAKTIIQIINNIRNRVGERITKRSLIREKIEHYDCDHIIKEGCYELVDGIYNQVLGIASSADVVQSSNSQEQSHKYIKAGYSLAAYIQETSNSHHKSNYVPWEIFEFDGIEGAKQAEDGLLQLITDKVPWGRLLGLSKHPSWQESLVDYKRSLASLQKTDKALSNIRNRINSDLADLERKHNTQQNILRKAWNVHVDNTRKFLRNSPHWKLTESRIFFSSSRERNDDSAILPFYISYSHFKTKWDVASDVMYANWQRNSSLKGRMDAKPLFNQTKSIQDLQ